MLMILVQFYEPEIVKSIQCIKGSFKDIYRIYPIFGMQPLQTVKTETLLGLLIISV